MATKTFTCTYQDKSDVEKLVFPGTSVTLDRGLLKITTNLSLEQLREIIGAPNSYTLQETSETKPVKRTKKNPILELVRRKAKRSILTHGKVIKY
jgi:hypothetical protein